MKAIVTLFIISLFIQSCASLRNAPKHQLSNGYYEFRQGEGKFRRVYVDVQEDTLVIYPVNGGERVSVRPSKDEFFRTRTFDGDVIIVWFKYRPAATSLPRQINTNFNGQIYLGYRVDRFQIHYNETPAGLKKMNHHRAFTIGTFGGLGAASVTPWTTNYQITDEYNGVVLSRGLAAMIGINNLTFGVGVGWDHLTDRDRSVWIYQNKPWFGLTVGPNIH